MSGFDEERADIVAQNGNDGLHYDAVNHPKHYLGHPSGIECIQLPSVPLHRRVRRV